jgi:hypothetical protein
MPHWREFEDPGNLLEPGVNRLRQFIEMVLCLMPQR